MKLFKLIHVTFFFFSTIGSTITKRAILPNWTESPFQVTFKKGKVVILNGLLVDRLDKSELHSFILSFIYLSDYLIHYYLTYTGRIR